MSPDNYEQSGYNLNVDLLTITSLGVLKWWVLCYGHQLD
jgi:hypothetical protein